MKFKALIFALNIACFNFNYGIITESEVLFSDSVITKWRIAIKDNGAGAGYIIFSKNNRSGFIDHFYVNPEYRGLNNDYILMLNALDKLFTAENVDDVQLSPAPFGLGSNEQRMSLHKLINYYHNKFGFELCEDNKYMCLSKERYLKSLFQQRSKL